MAASFVSADAIGDANLNVFVVGSTTNNTLKIAIVNDEYAGNNHNYTVTLTNTSHTFTHPFKVLLIKNGTIENLNFLSKYEQCVTDKIGYERGWQGCVNDLAQYKNSTTGTDCKNQLNTAQNTISNQQNDISELNGKITTLEEAAEKTKNSKWIFGVIGIIIGVVGYMAKEGKINSNVRDKSAGEFHRGLGG